MHALSLGHREVALPQFLAVGAVLFDAVAVVDELCDRQGRGELRHAARVVPMEVRRDEVVDLARFRLARKNALDALHVAPLEPRPPGVHQDRVASGRNDQSSGATLYVYPVNVERVSSENAGGQ